MSRANLGEGASRVGEHDPQSFEELFQAEPAQPSASETSDWINIYERLVAILENQLEETRRFGDGLPAPLQRYLSRENVTFLMEELKIFQDRLAFWKARRGSE